MLPFICLVVSSNQKDRNVEVEETTGESGDLAVPAAGDDVRPTTSRAPTIVTSQSKNRRIATAFLHIFFFSWFGSAGRFFSGLFGKGKKNKTTASEQAAAGK